MKRAMFVAQTGQKVALVFCSNNLMLRICLKFLQCVSLSRGIIINNINDGLYRNRGTRSATQTAL